MAKTGNIGDDIELLMQNVARLSAGEGDAKLVSIIANANIHAQVTGYDSWDGGTDEYTVYIEMPHHIYNQVRGELTDISDLIQQKLGNFLHSYEKAWVKQVSLSPMLVESKTWREDAKSWLAGGKINNQGRVRSDNIAGREWDGLLFRSQPEINLYKALKARGVAFAPLPVFLKGGETYSRIEPDFIVIKEGIVLCIEIDGDTVHTESPAEADDRTRVLKDEGVMIEHYSARRCETMEDAKELAEEIVAKISRYKANRL